MAADTRLATKLKTWWFRAYPLIFALSYSQAALFEDNQNTKFIVGLARAGYRDIASDWLAGITDPFPLFSFLLTWQVERLGVAVGVHAAFFLLTAVYAMAALWLARQLLAPCGNRAPDALVWFSLLWFLIHADRFRGYWALIFPDGLGEQYVLSDYYQPCCFGVLLLMGIAAYNARRLAAAAGCFLLAPLFHPAYTLTAAMIVVALAVVPASRCVPAVRRWLFPAAVLALLALYAAWCIRALTSAPDVRLLAHRILADTRIPHHAHPATWDLAPVFTFFAVAGAAAWTARRRSVGQALGLLLSATAVLLAWTVLGDHATLAVLAPWRVSAVLAPLSWIVLVAAAANGFARWWPGPPPFTEPRLTGCIALATLLLCVVGVLGLVRDYRAKHARADYAVTRFLSEYHEPGFLYVTPLAETHLRLEAGVPVYATWKSHPTRDSEFLIWYDRVQAVDAFYGGGTNAATVFRARLAPAGVTHVLWPASGGAFPLASAGRRLYRDEHYSLWDARTP